MQDIIKEIAGCKACPLHIRRTCTVPGEGSLSPDLLLVGEGPGNEEDLSGRPFVGPVGMLLNRLLKDAGILREQVYVTNIVKCRPPENREPTVAEALACRTFLKRQVGLLKPKVIVALGRPATQAVAGVYGSVQDLQEVPNLRAAPLGTEIPVVICHHPSYLLRLLKGFQTDKILGRKIYDNFQMQLKLALALSKGETFPEEQMLDLDSLF